jgi:glycerol-3-phosphate acyltransferase PlsX
MALAKIVLKTVSGIHRPAIASVFPTLQSPTIMLDLGANVLVDAQNLAQFAVLGAVFAKAHKGVAMPTVGLLNVGTEETKGPDHVKGAAAMLSNVDFPGQYKGFVEGTDITAGTVDVVVCDGYAGNIALKAAEGVGKMSGQYFRDALNSGVLARLGGLLAYFSLKKLKNRIDPRRYNGGVFLGLNGICIKSHGSSDAFATSRAIALAIDLSRKGYVETIAKDISHLMSQETLLAEGAYRD